MRNIQKNGKQNFQRSEPPLTKQMLIVGNRIINRNQNRHIPTKTTEKGERNGELIYK